MSATIVSLADARTQRQVAEVMRDTLNAYSRPAYGDAEWARCAALLLGMGYDIPTVVALMDSRLMRWARDDAADYDAPTVADLARFLASPAGANALRYEVAA